MNNSNPLAPETKPNQNSSPITSNRSALNTQNLFPKGSRERKIVHDNTEYRLRITAQGKLILTK